MGVSLGEGQGTEISRVPAITERFDVLRVLGRGAAGAVYLVRDKRSGDELALKVLKNPTAFDERTVDRFLQELTVCRSINHPNLVRAFELIQGSGVIGFTMEYVPGMNLLEVLAGDRMTPERIDSLFVQILGGLEALHGHEIVHRDVKLENILVSDNGTAKLSDLGLVKRLDGEQLTKTGILLGTAAYLPPEYITRSAYDARGDLFALGVVLFEVLQRRRFMDRVPQGRIIEERLRAQFRMPPATLDGAYAKYRPILERATASSPRHRFQSAAEMRAAFLGEVQPTAAARARVAGSPQVLDFGAGYESRKRWRRILLLAGATLLIAISQLL